MTYDLSVALSVLLTSLPTLAQPGERTANLPILRGGGAQLVDNRTLAANGRHSVDLTASTGYTCISKHWLIAGSLTSTTDDGATVKVSGRNVSVQTTLPQGAPTGINGPSVAYSPDGALNVKAFGAKGDSASDDTAAIVAAIAAAPSGGSIYVPPSRGAYMLSGTVTIAKPLTLWIDGKATLSFAPKSPLEDGLLIRSFDVVVKGGAINGNARVVNIVRKAGNGQRGEINGVTITGTTTTGQRCVYIDGTTPAVFFTRITNVNVMKCDTGLLLTGLSNATFVNNFNAADVNLPIDISTQQVIVSGVYAQNPVIAGVRLNARATNNALSNIITESDTAPAILFALGANDNEYFGAANTGTGGVLFDGGTGNSGSQILVVKKQIVRAITGSSAVYIKQAGTAPGVGLDSAVLYLGRIDGGNPEWLQIEDLQDTGFKLRVMHGGAGSSRSLGIDATGAGNQLVLSPGGSSRFIGTVGVGKVTFATLPSSPAAFDHIGCTDCDTPTVEGATCTSVGDKAGAEAIRLRGAWKCF